MEFDYSYRRSSEVSNTGSETAMSFSPDLLREPTYFRGELSQKIPFREAISALHDVVVSDARYKPKDRAQYMAWLDQQQIIDWQSIADDRRAKREELKTLQGELNQIYNRQHALMGPFYKAQQRYFDYLYKRDYDAWFVLDPVITVHPDEVFFECFSQDEASYGRLSCGFEVFDSIGEFACGTTNVDYSQALYDEFQKIRSYKGTRLEVDPAGFEVQTTMEEAHKEVKIDLPDSWVRGFLQVSSAMTMRATRFTLHPMDVHNLCFLLRRNKELLGPRSMRYLLRPGQPVSVVFDPWGKEVRCPRSIYHGTEEEEIRVWGRRRLHALERLVPIAKGFEVLLLGSGMPSFYLADLGSMTFTLGLSGWTKNDWSQAANFDLMAPREDVDTATKESVFAALRENWFESAESLSSRMSLDKAQVESALASYVQAGRAIYDLKKGVYRVRELSREPLPVEALRFQNVREERATRFLHQGKVSVRLEFLPEGAMAFAGAVVDNKRTYQARVVLDAERRMVDAECGCNYYQQNRLYKGPCEHMLALRIAEHRGISDKVDLRKAEKAGDARRAWEARKLATEGAAAAQNITEGSSQASSEVAPRRGLFSRLFRGGGASPEASDDSGALASNRVAAVMARLVSDMGFGSFSCSNPDDLAADLSLAILENTEAPRDELSHIVLRALRDSQYVWEYHVTEEVLWDRVREYVDELFEDVDHD